VFHKSHCFLSYAPALALAAVGGHTDVITYITDAAGNASQ
jgi:hypothetical protein